MGTNCSGQGLRGHHQRKHNNVSIQRFIRIPLNPGESLLRCGINTSNGYTQLSHNHLTVYIWRMPHSIHSLLQYTKSNNHSRTLPRNRTGRLARARWIFPQTPPGTRKSPELPPQLSGNLLRHAWSSLFHFSSCLTSKLPRKGGYPQCLPTSV